VVANSDKRVPKGRPRGDAEFGKDPVQMGADRPVREEQALSDLLVRHAGGSQLRNLVFLTGQHAGQSSSAARLNARDPQLTGRPADPGHGAQSLKRVEGSLEVGTGLGIRPHAAEVFPVQELHPGEVERPADRTR
jgi:hypothetical protein